MIHQELPSKILETDVLVVGGGGAGMMAALEANQKGCKVTLVDKSIPSRACATLMAKQLAATGPWSYPNDFPEKHLRDTLISGCFINNKELVTVFVTQAGSTIRSLEEMGMLFERDHSGKTFLSGGEPPGHSYPRSLAYKEMTGKMIMDTLRRQAIKRDIRMLPDILVVRLLVEDNEIRGAIAWNIAKGEIFFVLSKAVILATGGCGQLYPMTSNPIQSTGEGYILGFEAGTELIDLEMFQFYPVSLVYPTFLRGLNINFRGRLLNVHLERFMEKMDPMNLENVTRDKLSQAIYGEIKKGRGTLHGGVYLDASGFEPELYEKKYPTEYQYCLEAGIDLKKDLVEVAPSAHFMMGGIKIDKDCCTKIKGLFAAGEVAGGLHGANRLANNALTEIFVFGKIAGQKAYEFASQREWRPPSRGLAKEGEKELKALLRPKREFIRGFQLKEMLRNVMWDKVGVIREISQLKEGVQRLQEIKEAYLPKLGTSLSHRTYSRDIVNALEALSMAKLAPLIAQSALMRKESRGAHYLEDSPRQNDARYLKNVMVTKNAEGETSFKLIPVVGER